MMSDIRPVSMKTVERYDSYRFVCLSYPVRNCSHVCVYHLFPDVLILCFHASNSILYNAQIFVAVLTLSPRFVPGRYICKLADHDMQIC